MESYEDLSTTSHDIPDDLLDLDLNQFDATSLLPLDSESSSSLDTCAVATTTTTTVSDNNNAAHVVGLNVELQQLIARTHSVRCTLKYYEKRTRVGDEFVARGDDVVVDGFTAPLELQNGARFCLGQLANAERNDAIDKVRKTIGNGRHLPRLATCR
jgi:hypothetical protein